MSIDSRNSRDRFIETLPLCSQGALHRGHCRDFIGIDADWRPRCNDFVTAANTPTRADQAYERLRADILHGRIEPGARLRVEALAATYGLSSGVIREALPRLVGQGLAVSTPQRGVRVVSVDPDDLQQLTEAAIEVETLVLRKSIAEGSLDWEAQVLATHHHLSRLDLRNEGGEINEDWSVAHTRFHLALLDGCSNHRLKGVASSLRDAGEVYRQWADRPGELTPEDHVANHRRLCEFSVARDADAAVEALRQHIELTTTLILRDQQAEPEAPASFRD